MSLALVSFADNSGSRAPRAKRLSGATLKTATAANMTSAPAPQGSGATQRRWDTDQLCQPDLEESGVSLQIRNEAAVALYFVGTSKFVDSLPNCDVSILGERKRPWALRQRELEALARQGTSVGDDIMEFVGECPTDEVVQDAASVLERAGMPLDAFERWARDKNTSVRAVVMRALGRGADDTRPSRLRLLSTALLTDSEPEVRDAAVASVACIGGIEAKLALTEALRQERSGSVVDAIKEVLSDLA